MAMKQLRRVVQLGFLALFVTLLVGATARPVRAPDESSLFLRADPLAMLASVLSGSLHSPLANARIALEPFIPALAMLGLTALFGRFFCGWICPLGTCIDLGDKALSGRKRRGRRDRGQAPRAKYYVLAGVLASAVAGGQIGWLLDPIPLLTRTFATSGYGAGVWLYNLGVVHGRRLLLAAGIRAYPVGHVGFSLSALVVVICLAILALGLLSRRYWCRNLCPLGALLGLVGRFGIWKRQVTERCSNCKICARSCKMNAIPRDQPRRTITPECILCYDCISCKGLKSTSIGINRLMELGADGHVDVGKRQLIYSIGGGIAYGAVASLGLSRRALPGRLLRPPGALVRQDDTIAPMGERQFRELCLRCGECMRACPTHGLQPAVGQAGLDGIFTPVLVPRVGECAEACTACGDVCPSGALTRFTIPEKRDEIRIGRASVDPATCLCWQMGDNYRLCLLCVEQCPYGAVVARDRLGARRPVVDFPEKCTGCGKCEKECPVKPGAAITVSRLEDGR
jgi:polyferredoxin